MPQIIKKCFLFHYDPSINSDKVFNLFLIDNENGTFSAISEYGRAGTKLNIKPLIENCSLVLAQSKYSAKLNDKIYHNRTPYTHTLNGSGSPTLQKFSAGNESAPKTGEPAKVFDFKPTDSKTELSPEKNKSGEQNVSEDQTKHSKRIGVLNLDRLDALEI